MFLNKVRDIMFQNTGEKKKLSALKDLRTSWRMKTYSHAPSLLLTSKECKTYAHGQ